MFPTLIRRLASTARPALTIKNNPYKAKKLWPPDFSKLSTQEQFRMEKRYKRRLILATKRPRWDRFLRMVQFFSIGGVVVYVVLFIDSDKPEGKEPFAKFRSSVWGFFGLQRQRSKPEPPLDNSPKRPSTFQTT